MKTNGQSIRDGLETIGRDGFPMSRESLQLLGRESLQAGREGLQASREGLQAIGSSMADLAETLPLRPKRRRSFPLLGAIVVAIAGVAIIALIAGLQARRDGMGPLKGRSKMQATFEDDAATRKNGMGTVGASAADDLVGRSQEPEKLPEYSGMNRTAGA